jgi:hypothetical protein
MQESQEPKPVEAPGPVAAAPPGLTNRQIVGLVVVGIVVLLLVIALFYGLATHPFFTSILRDISIIVLALVTVIIGLFLIVLIFQLQSLISLLRYEIKPILDSANETVNTVRGTTTFVSDSVVTPMIRVASFASGVGRAVATMSLLFRGVDRRPEASAGEPEQDL